MRQTWWQRAGRRAPPFDPRAISGLTCDVDPARGVTLAGSLVSALTEQSGGTRSFTAAGKARPTWGAASGACGLPGITFDGVANALTGPVASGILAVGAFTILAVVKPVAVALDQAAYYNNNPICGDASAYAAIAMRNTATTPSVIGGVYAGAQNAQAPGLALATHQLITMRLTNPTLLVQRAGDAAVTSACGAVPTLASTFQIGGVINALFGNFVLSRLLAWNVSLSAADLLAAQRAIGAAYGVTAP